MPQIEDPEFGTIKIRTAPTSRKISIKLAPSGQLQITAPRFTPKTAIKLILTKSRNEIRQMVSSQQVVYDTDQQIGKSHNLVIETRDSPTKVMTAGTRIIVSISDDDYIANPQIQSEIRKHIIKALRKEAKSYLPRRLAHLADKFSFSYSSTRLTHAGSRWGSCSSNGTISMNISLMRLPFEIIDYVLIHELCHTQQMNHSKEFWELVNTYDPSYEMHRRRLKDFSPTI